MASRSLHLSSRVLAAIMIWSIPAIRPSFLGAAILRVPRWEFWTSITSSNDTTPALHAYFLVVENGFRDAHSVSLPPSSSSASYDCFWNENEFATIQLEAAHVAEDVSPNWAAALHAGSSGRIYVTALADLRVRASAEYSYSLPPNAFVSYLRLDFIRTDPIGLVYRGRQRVDSWAGRPVSGTLRLQADEILPCGLTYYLEYSLETVSGADGTGLLGRGNGTLDIEIGAAPPRFSAGDMNCDGAVDFRDAAPLVLALLDVDGFLAAHPGCCPHGADLNGDGIEDGRDIAPFIDAAAGP